LSKRSFPNKTPNYISIRNYQIENKEKPFFLWVCDDIVLNKNEIIVLVIVTIIQSPYISNQ